ncbi:GDP-mannose 4,6-dehydratase [bacterium]|nr:GDP-mannose 4,6-dehydratase [bacterium]
MITGCAGFIGSALAQRLLEEGFEIVGVDCFLDLSYSAETKQEAFTRLEGIKGFFAVRADIRDDLPDKAWDGVSAVVNLAAMPGLSKSWEDFDVYNGCNFVAVNRLLEKAKEVGLEHFIQISTSSVYGQLALGSENDALEPISPYGVTKLAGERLVAAYGRSYGLAFTILRYFSVYGPGQRPDMAYHIIAERILNRVPVTVFGDGSQSRSNTFIDDAVRATIAALAVGPTSTTMNIAGGREVTLLEAIEHLERALGQQAIVRFDEPRRGDQLHTRGDTSRAKTVLGYEPQIEPAEGLAAQAEWHMRKRS